MSSQRSKSTLLILFSVIVIDLIGFGIVLPILPFYAKAFGASGFVLGLLLATHALLQFLFSPVWGRLSDRIGRRPVMLVTMAGTSVALLLLGMADSIIQLFIARALSGLFAANISVATAYVSDVTAEEERTRWMGMVGASFGIGFLLGPAIGGLLAPYGHGLPMFVAAGMAAANCIYALFVLREPERHATDDTGPAGLFESLRDRLIARLCGTNFLFTLAITQLESTFAYFMMDRFAYDARQVAFILVMMAAIMATIQGGAMRSLAKRYGEKTLLMAGLLLMAVTFVSVPSIFSVSLLLVPLAGSALGRAIAQPPLTSMVSMQADPAHRGAVMGAYQSSAALARVVGPVVAGALYDVYAGNPLYLASLMLLLSFGLAARLPRVGPTP